MLGKLSVMSMNTRKGDNSLNDGPATSLRHQANLLVIGAIICTLLGFALRAHLLQSDAFWIDELLTIQTANSEIERIFLVRDHPPLFYLFTKISLNLFGENEFAARLPALFAGTLTLPLLYSFGRQLKQGTAGILAAGLLAISPLGLEHSQEARHYALLAALSLLSYVFLYRALQRPSRRHWLLYALSVATNLYTHYGALIVLASQTVIIAIWCLSYFRSQKSLRLFKRALLSALVVTILYSAWIPRLVRALTFNVGEDITTGTGTVTPLSTWLSIAFDSFSMLAPEASLLTLVMVAGGAIVWLRQRSWENLIFTALAMVLPFFLITSFDIARGAYARYIIYLLPFYLFFAGVLVDNILRASLRINPLLFGALSVIFFASAVHIGESAVRRQYDSIKSDWYGVLDYLREQASEDDLLVLMSLNYQDGWNLTSNSLPYYLERARRSYHTLSAHHVNMNDVNELARVSGDVWVVLDNWVAKKQILELPLDVVSFPTHLYVVHENQGQGTALEKTIHLYQELLPLARSPSPQCLLHQDLAFLYLANEAVREAKAQLDRSIELCPSVPVDAPADRRPELEFAIEEADLQQALENGNMRSAQAHAMSLLQYDDKHEIALETVTAFNLAELFLAGDARVSQNEAPEEVRMETFVMPDTGDWGNVLLVHPPASVGFALSLPEQPVTFTSRVALAPESWAWGGDGVTFIVYLEEEDGHIQELYQRHIGNSAEDHRWHDVQISLREYAGKDVVLFLATKDGPAGDGTGDWAGWEMPRLRWSIQSNSN